MVDFAIFTDWITFAVRWLHVVTAIAWIGSSFYFIALDLGLKSAPSLPVGAHGEQWQVHGGGFYHIRKFLVAPENMPEDLIWFKYESYFTWLSGFALLALVYYLHADLFLIDRNVLDVPAWQAIAISVASLAIGWLIYDSLCKSPIGASQNGLMIVLFGVLVTMAWGYTQVFSGRAALLHLGAFTATIMSANVFMIIIPNQKIVVADLIAGRVPDAKYGKIAKQRSLHNNYLTLPVIFLMLSNHYPLAFASEYNWLIASIVFLIGVLIRHFFNTMHAGKGTPHWTWAASAVLFIIMIWLSSLSVAQASETASKNPSETASDALSPRAAALLKAPAFAAVADIVQSRCSMCHAAGPVWEGLYWAPKGVMLDTDERIAQNALQIYLQAGVSHAMPPQNITGLSDEDRAAIVSWFRGEGL
jgi:uncharacterized membrane protein